MKRNTLIFVAIFFIISITFGFDVKKVTAKSHKSIIKLVTNKEISKKKLSMRIGLINVHNAKNYYTGKAVVLTYHHISDKDHGPITISVQRFDSDIRMLRDRGFNVISLRDSIAAMEGKGTMPPNAVVITFDDGIESFYKYAYPILLQYQMPATNFIITSRNESYKPSNNDYNPLSPAEINEMYNSHLIDIQSHSNDSHEKVYINAELKLGPKLTNRIYNKDTKTLESFQDYENRVISDLNKSRELIYKYTGQYSDILCFPYGVYNTQIIELAKKCGFNYFVTTHEGTNKQDSKQEKISRIRSGDEKLDSTKVYDKILEITNSKKVN